MGPMCAPGSWERNLNGTDTRSLPTRNKRLPCVMASSSAAPAPPAQQRHFDVSHACGLPVRCATTAGRRMPHPKVGNKGSGWFVCSKHWGCLLQRPAFQQLWETRLTRMGVAFPERHAECKSSLSGSIPLVRMLLWVHHAEATWRVDYVQTQQILPQRSPQHIETRRPTQASHLGGDCRTSPSWNLESMLCCNMCACVFLGTLILGYIAGFRKQAFG